MTRWLALYRWMLLHSVRMTTASTAAYVLAYALGLSEGLAAAITAMVVTQSNLGGSLKMASDQIIGSMLGAIYAAGVALVVQPDDMLSSAAALALALGPLALLAARSPGFRVAPITAAVVLLSGAGLQFSPMGLAGQRLLGVGLGCGIGLLVSILLVPARATRSMIETVDEIAGFMADQLQALANGGTSCQDVLALKSKQTRESLIRLALLAEDAAHEKRAWLAEAPDGQRMLQTLRRLRHDIDMLRRAAREAGSDAVHESVATSWQRAAESGAATLRSIRKMIGREQVPEDFNTLAPTVREYRSAVDEMRQTGVTHSLSTDELSRLFGIGFALDQLRRDLDDLIEIAEEVSHFRKNFTVVQ